MLLTVKAANGKKFEVEVINRRVVTLNGRGCGFLNSSCRSVYRCGKYVIKIDGPYSGQSHKQQNTAEYERWKKIKRHDRKYFATIIGMATGDDYSVLIQRYVRGKNPYDVPRTMFDRAYKIADKYDINDVYESNYVIIKNRPVIYDMGL